MPRKKKCKRTHAQDSLIGCAAIFGGFLAGSLIMQHNPNLLGMYPDAYYDAMDPAEGSSYSEMYDPGYADTYDSAYPEHYDEEYDRHDMYPAGEDPTYNDYDERINPMAEDGYYDEAYDHEEYMEEYEEMYHEEHEEMEHEHHEEEHFHEEDYEDTSYDEYGDMDPSEQVDADIDSDFGGDPYDYDMDGDYYEDYPAADEPVELERAEDNKKFDYMEWEKEPEAEPAEPAQPHDEPDDLFGAPTDTHEPEYEDEVYEAEVTESEEDAYDDAGFDVSPEPETDEEYIVEENMWEHGKEALLPFDDVPESHQYHEAIAGIKEEGLVEGNADGTYQPDKEITRAAFTKIIMEQMPDSPHTVACKGASSDTKIFSDVSLGEWFGPSVCKAKLSGIITGYADGTFQPAAPISYAESSVILARTYGLGEGSPDEPWYRHAVNTLYEQSAQPATVGAVDQDITRGEMAFMMYAMMDRDMVYAAAPSSMGYEEEESSSHAMESMSSSSTESSESSDPHNCEEREEWNENLERCVCKSGLTHSYATGKCECNQNKMWDSKAGKCTCPPPRSETNTGYCGCPIYEDYDPETNTCNCPEKQVRNEKGQCGCPAPSKLKYGTCKCPDAKDILATEGQVCACPDGATYNTTTNKCECSGGRVLHEVEYKDLWECRCPDKGQRWHEGDQKCKNVHSVDVRLPLYKSLLRGRITSADGHIDCKPRGDWQDCYQLYWEGRDITLTYHNPTEFIFGSWGPARGLTDSGPCDCVPASSETCTISSISRSQRCQANLGYKRKDEVE